MRPCLLPDFFKADVAELGLPGRRVLAKDAVRKERLKHAAQERE